MVQARIHQGRVEVQGPIPQEWEGQFVKLLPLTPDDPMVDLEERLATLQALGPIELEVAEREQIAATLAEMDQRSREAMRNIAGRTP